MQNDGWQHRLGRWELRWYDRVVAVVTVQPDGTVHMTLNALKMWQVKHVRANSVDQAKRYGERWCAARLLPGVPLREAVATLLGAGTGRTAPGYPRPEQ